MIRSRRLAVALLDAWLINHAIVSSDPTYRLRLWRENRAELPAIKDELIAYLDEAHEDARRRLRAGFEDDLSPFGDPAVDPAAGYPALLHRNTLQGYLGETLAVLAVEHWGAHDHHDWVVPAFLFRLHDQEFQHLEDVNERRLAGEAYDPDEGREMRPGRTGDDGIAFRKNDDNTITDILTLEAKCLASHNSTKVREAHKKLAAIGSRPSGVRELVNLLTEYDTPEADEWHEALLSLWKSGYPAATRFDGVGYTCGNAPRRGSRTTWMAADAPDPAYTATRRLECLEFQVEDLNALVDALYRGA